MSVVFLPDIILFQRHFWTYPNNNYFLSSKVCEKKATWITFLALDVGVITLMNYSDIESFHLACESNVIEHSSGHLHIHKHLAERESLYVCDI